MGDSQNTRNNHVVNFHFREHKVKFMQPSLLLSYVYFFFKLIRSGALGNFCRRRFLLLPS